MTYILPETFQDYDGLEIGETLVVRSRDGWLRDTRVHIIDFLSDGRLIVEAELPVENQETHKVASQLGLKLKAGQLIMSRFDLRRIGEAC